LSFVVSPHTHTHTHTRVLLDMCDSISCGLRKVHARVRIKPNSPL